MMKKYNYYLVFFLMMFFGQIQAGIYPNYSQTITVPNLNANGQAGTGTGTISILNDILTINISVSWATPQNLKNGVVASLSIYLPNMELGQLSSAPGSPLANYAAKIENNNLVFYPTNAPNNQTSCYLNFAKNLACTFAPTWYLDNDLDGLGDPTAPSFTQCIKPDGNYVTDSTDNCPLIPGTNVNCASLEASLQNQNLIKNITYKTATAVSITNPTILQADQNITYFDGLGRPVQQIAYQASGSGKDIVTPIEYDIYGRQNKEYLPYASTQNNLNYINPLTLIPNLVTQYQTNYGAVNNNPFSEKQLESSPVSRVLQQASPGNDWALVNNHTIKMDYQTNLDTDYVQNYIATATWNPTLGLYNIGLTKAAGNGFYTSNKLYKTITYDENTTASPLEVNGSTVEFKNKEGQVVLKRTYSTVGTGTTNEKYDTYYVYDSYGNLTYVIPPKAVDLMTDINGSQANIASTAVTTSGNTLQLKATNSITLSTGFNAQSGSTFSAVIDNGNQTVLDNLCYQYKYDSRNRLVEKKLPGKQWEFTVYDKLDRVVANGPFNSPFTDITSVGWSVTKYDALNRPVLTGWLSATIINTTNRKTLQDTQNGFPSNFISETKIASTTNSIIPPVTGVKFRYTNLAWPNTDYHVLTVNYFDDYSYTDAPTIFTTVANANQIVYYNATDKKPNGLITGSWTRILEASTIYRYEQAYILYDKKARPVRTYSQNYLQGFTYTDSKLDDFSGQLKYNITHHQRAQSGTEIITTDTFTYTSQDRLQIQTHLISPATTAEIITENNYNELGQLISKKIGNNTQKVDYTYNIRGWMTAINDISALTKVGDPKDLFAFKINYNDPTSIPGINRLYNGNIVETSWTSSSESNPLIRGYGYTYDNLNRLKNSNFKRDGTVTNAYSENLTYDKNSNIMSIIRNGNNETPQQIDNLTYSYLNNTNQLAKVVDSAPTAYKVNGFTDSAANSIDDYSYDNNGNITMDNNKNITAISYNHLNLPNKITFATTGNITYLYNALGQKVQKIVTISSPASITTTDYLGGYQYNNTVLKFFPTGEGYVEPAGSSYKYVYQYKDHLGNVRLSYDKTLVIQEENNYYPFGLKHIGYNNVSPSSNDVLKYKYNGKELQDDNIGGFQLNLYDYGARNYDSALGRWMNIDPLAETSRRFSPYVYVLNNPMSFIDLDGMEAKEVGTDEMQAQIGADGLTNEQWLETSRQGANPNLTTQYQHANKNQVTITEENNLNSKTDKKDKPSFLKRFWNWLIGKKRTSAVTVGPLEVTKQQLWYEEQFKNSLNNKFHNTLTFGDAVWHYRLGNGMSVDVNTNSLDFGNLKVSDFNTPEFIHQGSPGIWVKFDNKSNFVNPSQALIYGTIDVVYIGNNNIMVLPNKYDFDLKLTGPSTFNRDFATVLGAWYNGYGTPYWINFIGTTKIPN